MNDQTTNFVGSVPEYYDRDLGPVIFADFADDMARRAAATAPANLLEIAAGTGIVSRRLRDVLPPGARLTVTDLNPPMLEVARVKFAAGEAVEFRPADATSLPFGDAEFDAVVCQFGVMFFPDKGKSYAEAYRVLRPGGRYLFSVWDALRHNPYGRIADELMMQFFPADPPQFYRVPFSYHRLDPIADALAEAGFVDLQIFMTRRVKEVADIAPFARGFVYGNPATDQISARGGDPEAVRTAMEAAYRREFGSNPSRMPLQIIVFEARRP
jgi:ubiquinone/menaquinone biosynthesis C-methylase UbiE